MAKIKVYVAGPYRKPDPCANTHKTVCMANHLSSLGYVPYVPHLTLLWNTITPKPEEWWLQYDLEWLSVCDVMLRLPGESAGADGEAQFANDQGIPVLYSVEDLVDQYPPTLNGRDI